MVVVFCKHFGCKTHFGCDPDGCAFWISMRLMVVADGEDTDVVFGCELKILMLFLVN